MRKFLVLILALFIVFSVGCSNKSDGINDIYTITFLYEDGAKVVKTISGGENFEKLPEIEQKRGYDAVWEIEDFSTIDKDTTVKVIYTPKVYKIHYDLGACPNATITASVQEIEFNSEITTYRPYLETIVDFDYLFIKWVISGTDEEFTAEKYEFTEDIYLTAIWHKYTPDF
jgi:hypothetical protein